MCCSVLQSVLQRVALRCNMLQCVAANDGSCHEYVCVAVFYSVIQRVVVCCSVLQCVAVCCSVLQCVASHCSALQCDAVCGNKGCVMS